MPFKPEVEIHAFENANQAIMDIKQRKIKGAKVLVKGVSGTVDYPHEFFEGSHR